MWTLWTVDTAITLELPSRRTRCSEISSSGKMWIWLQSLKEARMEMSYKCFRNSSRAFLQALTNHVSTKGENVQWPWRLIDLFGDSHACIMSTDMWNVICIYNVYQLDCMRAMETIKRRKIEGLFAVYLSVNFLSTMLGCVWIFI
jgi:hypothetical protein